MTLDVGCAASFLVDTGSNSSAISESLAAALRLPIIAQTTLASAIGQKTRLVTRIEHLALGSVSAAGVLATIIPDADLDLPDAAGIARVQGVVGQDVLAALRYTIDYRARRIVWRESVVAPPRSAAVLALEPRDDRFLVVLPQDRSTLRLVPDSGSEGLVLFQRSVGLARPATSRTRVSGVAGGREGRAAILDALRIGPTTLNDVPVVIVENQPAAETADGLLPLHIFARVTFNGPEREIVIER